MTHEPALSRRQRGFSLIDIMVGIVIALIAVLVIYQVFDVAEGIKRNVTGAGDAQQNGLLSSFSMALQLSNAGANVAVVGDDNELGVCPSTDIASTLRPIPVLVTAGASDTDSDSFVVNYGASERLVTPVNFASNPTLQNASTTDFVVQSPLGFRQNDVVVVVSPDVADATKRCAWSVISSVDAGPGTAGPGPGPADSDGFVTIKHGNATPADATFNGNSSLINLGQAPHRIRFDIDLNQKMQDGTTFGTLRSTELFYVDTSNPSSPFVAAGEGAQPTPIANNVVLMKIQYGIGDPSSGFLQKWVKAANDGTDDWSSAGVLAMNSTNLSRIKAVRIALIVMSESYDKCAYADVCPSPTTNTFNYTLFGQCDGIPCPDPITGSYDPTPGQGNFRYRVYETVIPLRNAVWNLRKVS
jgi:type IV pilus assembly protein PilW